MKKSVWSALSLVLLASMVLTACGGGAAATATTAPVAPTTASVAQPTAAAAEPTTAPTAAAAEATTAPTAAAAEATATTAPAAEATKPPEPTATAAIIGSGKTKITIWHQWDGAYLNAITDAFTQYVKDHPDVTIDLSKPNDVSASLKVAVPAGEGPDIIGWANDQIGVNALAGNIVPLDTYGVDQKYLEGIYEPAAVKGVVWAPPGGSPQVWALPETQEGIALVYNKKILTDDKYMPKAGDLTDLLAKAQAYAKDNPGKFLVCNQGLGGSDAYHVAPIYFGFGVPTYVDDQGKVYLNTPEAVKAGEWMVQFSQVAPKEASDEICTAGFSEGKYAMRWTGPWAIAGIEKAGIDYGILPMGKPFVGIKTMMLSKNAVDRKTDTAALDVMKYFTSADVQKKLSLANKTIPAQTKAIQDPEVKALASVAGFGEALNTGVPMANTPYANAQWGPVGDASKAIWTGAQKPQEALDAAQKAIEDAIAQMK